ncbi:MAG: flagellar basal body-associated FliL family protein [Porticoccus sp.]|nr:flagellar basal body-associated FliL family protein [Porticoccus sp.]
MEGTNEAVADSETEDTGAKPGKKKWLIIVVASVLCLILAAGYFFYMKENSATSEEGELGEQGELIEGPDGELIEGEEGVEEEWVEAPPPIFIKIGPMTVNLVSNDLGQHLLYTSLILKVDSEETQEIINTHMPEVDSRLLLLLSSKTGDELATVDGKTVLTEEILALLDKPFTQPQPTLGISAVLFSEFILQ